MSLTESIRLELDGDPSTLLDKILPLLEHGSTLAELRRAGGRPNREHLEALLAELERNGMLEQSSTRGDRNGDPAADEVRRFFANFRSLGSSSGTGETDGDAGAPEQLRNSRVAVIGQGRSAERLVRELQVTGVGRVDRCDTRTLEDAQTAADVAVLCDDGFNADRYRRLNRLCLDREITWTSFRDLGTRFEVGPTVIPFETGCWRCYELRRVSNDDAYELWAETATALSAQGRSLGALPSAPGPSLLAVEILKLLTGFSRPITRGTLFSFDLLRFEARLHPVLKIPRCAACGAAARGRPPWRIWNVEGPPP